MLMGFFVQTMLLMASAFAEDANAAEPNPPEFGPNVFLVTPDNAATYEGQWEDMYNKWHTWDDDAQFGEHRTAVLLQSGEYEIDINLPYYFAVVGLGKMPNDTVVKPGPKGVGLRVDATDLGNSDNTFWRTIENLEMDYDVAFWVSQAAPLRSVIVDGSLAVAGGDVYASGGALMNSKIGDISFGDQQQWYTRGTTLNPYEARAYQGSYVCVGCVDVASGAPLQTTTDWTAQQFEHSGLSFTDAPDVFAEKPYITSSDDKFFLQIPSVLENHAGHSWGTGESVPFEQVYVVQNPCTAEVINSKISAGKHVVFPPGVYTMSSPIVVNNAGIVILGFGFATLVPGDDFEGDALVQVTSVDGVRVAGLILQPPKTRKIKALLQWGLEESAYAGAMKDPGFIYDLIARAGVQSHDVAANYFVQINNGWVVGDNVWLWSVDHCPNSNPGGNGCSYALVDTALEVNGDNVRMYGLMAEHTNQDITVWHGEYGQTMFYQSEFRYQMGPRSNEKIEPGHWTSYRVTAHNHKAVGIGIYMIDVFDSDVMWPFSAQGGFAAITVNDSDTFYYGFKDTNALNWDDQRPSDEKITCPCWNDPDGECIQSTMTYRAVNRTNSTNGSARRLAVHV
jgi:hypothetical protein